jgi:hypothetical protein
MNIDFEKFYEFNKKEHEKEYEKAAEEAKKK